MAARKPRSRGGRSERSWSSKEYEILPEDRRNGPCLHAREGESPREKGGVPPSRRGLRSSASGPHERLRCVDNLFPDVRRAAVPQHVRGGFIVEPRIHAEEPGSSRLAIVELQDPARCLVGGAKPAQGKRLRIDLSRGPPTDGFLLFGFEAAQVGGHFTPQMLLEVGDHPGGVSSSGSRVLKPLSAILFGNLVGEARVGHRGEGADSSEERPPQR